MNKKLSWMSIGFGAAVFLAGAVLRERVAPLTMGTSTGFPPFEMIEAGEEGAVVGFDVDLAKAIAANAGRGLKIVDMPFEDLIPALESREVEMVLVAMTITGERAARVDFSAPYYKATQVVLHRADEPAPASKDAMKGRTVGAQAGTTSHALAREIAGAAAARPAATPKAVVEELLGGRADFALMDEPSARAFQKRIPELGIAELPFPEEFYGVAVRRGNAKLLGTINQTLKQLAADGRHDALVERWMVRRD